MNVVGLGRDLADTLKQPEHRDKERQVRYPSRGSNHFLATVTTSNYSTHVKDVVTTSIDVRGSHLPFKLAEAADIATEVTHSDSLRRGGLSDQIYLPALNLAASSDPPVASPSL